MEQARSRLGLRKMNEQEMGGMARGIKANMDILLTGHISAGLPNPNEVEFYNCEECGKRIDRFEFKPIIATNDPKIKIAKGTFVFPVCSCLNAISEKENLKRERLQRKNYMEQVYKQNLMNDKLKVARFENFEDRPGTAIAFRETNAFAGKFDRQQRGIMLFGNAGNGKSHLCAAIHHHLEAEGFVSLFLEVQRLFNLAEDARRFSSKINLNDVINAAINADLLTLDELGAGKLSQEEFSDVLFPIINGRQGKPTNYTTNLDLDELAQWFAIDRYGKPLDNKGRLIDRILGSCVVVQNTGTSKRIEDAARRLQGN